MDLGAWNGLLWLVFVVYWVAASFHSNKPRHFDSAFGRIVRLTTVVVGIALLFPALRQRPEPYSWISLLHLTVLNRRFLPAAPWIGLLGNVCTAAGVAFAIWARYHIGRNWSARVAIVSGHKLIRSGPYARIRHPIYTGIIAGLAGTALVTGEYRSLAGFAILASGLLFKAKREERLLAREFGEAFEEHRRATGFLFPRLS